MKLGNVFILIVSILILNNCKGNSDADEFESQKKMIDKFYYLESINDYKSIDKIIDYQFYQIIPYTSLVNYLENKKKFGKLRNRKLVKMSKSTFANNNDRFTLLYKLSYESKTIYESFIVIKDKDKYLISGFDSTAKKL